MLDFFKKLFGQKQEVEDTSSEEEGFTVPAEEASEESSAPAEESTEESESSEGEEKKEGVF